MIDGIDHAGLPIFDLSRRCQKALVANFEFVSIGGKLVPSDPLHGFRCARFDQSAHSSVRNHNGRILWEGALHLRRVDPGRPFRGSLDRDLVASDQSNGHTPLSGTDRDGSGFTRALPIDSLGPKLTVSIGKRSCVFSTTDRQPHDNDLEIALELSQHDTLSRFAPAACLCAAHRAPECARGTGGEGSARCSRTRFAPANTSDRLSSSSTRHPAPGRRRSTACDAVGGLRPLAYCHGARGGATVAADGGSRRASG